MDVNFELYKVFYYVAKHLSFSAAASELFISQSAVSQSIRLLEGKLKTSLFIRHTKKVKLTLEGRTLYEHIEKAFNLIKTGERNLNNINLLKQGEFKLAASDTICKYHLLPYFKKFSELYPNIKISITNRTSPDCMELLQKGIVDLSVVNIPEEERVCKNIFMQKLKAIHDVFIAGSHFAFLKNQTIVPEKLAQYPILMLERNTVTRCFFESFIKEHNLAITPEIELGSVDLLIELAKIGLGLSFVACEYVQKELADGELFVLRLTDNIPARYLGLATSSSLPLPLAAQKFVELFSPLHDE
jgi:DNA-binding transcriptional LysR family regulator